MTAWGRTKKSLVKHLFHFSALNAGIGDSIFSKSKTVNFFNSYAKVFSDINHTEVMARGYSSLDILQTALLSQTTAAFP